MTKTPGSLQDLSKSLYDKAKAEPTKRFWGLYVHVCKMETLQEAYEMAKKNDGAPGIDGVTFEVIGFTLSQTGDGLRRGLHTDVGAWLALWTPAIPSVSKSLNRDNDRVHFGGMFWLRWKKF